MRWGEARVEVLALKDEILAQLDAGHTVKSLFDRLADSGRITMCRAMFYRHVSRLREAAENARGNNLSPAHPEPSAPAVPADGNHSSRDFFQRPLKRPAERSRISAVGSSVDASHAQAPASSDLPPAPADAPSGPRSATAALPGLNWDASPEAVTRAVRKFWGEEETTTEEAAERVETAASHSEEPVT